MKVRAVRRRVVPPLDDDLAKEVSDADTLDTLREQVREGLAREAAREADRKLRADLMKALAARVTFEVPQVLVERDIDRRTQDFIRHLDRGADRPAAGRHRLERRSARTSAAAAEEAVKAMIVLDEVSRRENLEVSDEDLDREVARYAERSGRTHPGRAGAAREGRGAGAAAHRAAPGARRGLPAVACYDRRRVTRRHAPIADRLTTYAIRCERPPDAARADGRRADQPRRAGLRHLLAAAQGQHHLHRDADRRRGGEPGDRADAVPRVGGPGEGHPAVHQQPGRLDHGRAGDLRHDAVHPARRADLLPRPGGVDGRGPAGGRARRASGSRCPIRASSSTSR